MKDLDRQATALRERIERRVLDGFSSGRRRPVRGAQRAAVHQLVLGRDTNNQPFGIETKTRYEHTLVVGATGSGKSKFFVHGSRQDMAAGHGVMVVDPHDGGSPQGILRCLRSLYDHGYLDRPKVQLATLQSEGPRPFVYAISRKGARVLREQGGRIDDQVDWSEKNRRAGAIFMAHTLEVADFMVNLEVACREREEINLIAAADIINAAPERTRVTREPLRWEAESIERGKKEMWSVVPDGLFGLSYPDNTAACFLLELDRGTIPITRRGSR